MNEHGKDFEYLREKPSKLSDSQLKESIFIGLQFREIINDYVFEHLLKETEKSMTNVQSGLSKLPWKRKSRKRQGIVEDLLNAKQAIYVIEVLYIYIYIYIYIHTHTFSLELLPSEPGRSERRKWGWVPSGYFHHIGKICWKVVTEHVSWLLLEPYWMGVYCQFQTNELQRDVLNVSKIKHLFSHFYCVIALSYFHTAFLPLFLNS